ncbi:Gp37 family protein [Pinibacter soli]|uniref:Gp37 family protein n=1 Tax=Pinibacter soli TaxID=3044211 RepID=A0ABT6RBR3_9BACT|nr:Gp37 family protein [Pinibacter soli]MDI3319987.1 Gp37 family protein [Pinibacter soli]
MNISAIQSSIVTKLSTEFEALGLQFLAKDVPDSDKDYDIAVTKPVAYVVYMGSQALPSISTNVIAQVRNLQFNVEIHARTLYRENGLHVVRDIVEQILIGFKPLNSQRLFLLKDEISKTDQGIWVHILQLQCESRLIQVDEPRNIIIPEFKELVKED